MGHSRALSSAACSRAESPKAPACILRVARAASWPPPLPLPAPRAGEASGPRTDGGGREGLGVRAGSSPAASQARRH